jgi:hypothetical protein
MCDMKQADKVEYRRLLEEIGEDYCKAGTYCIFKEFLIAAHPSRRLLVQLKAVDKIKMERSEKAGRDIGWEAAMKLWVDEEYAEHFSDVYADHKHFKEIYHETLHRCHTKKEKKNDKSTTST